jgi:hypothetical protein
MIRIPLCIVALAWGLAASVPTFAAAEDFESYWGDLCEAVSTHDWDTLAKMVRGHPLHAERSFWRAVDTFAYFELSGSPGPASRARDRMLRIADQYRAEHDDPDFLRYTSFLLALDRERLHEWRDAFGDYHRFVMAYYRAASPGKAVRDLVREAFQLHEKPLRRYEALGDFYTQGMIHTCLGILHAKAEDLDAAQRSFEQARSCFEAIESGVQLRLTDDRLEGVAGLKGTPWDSPGARWEIVPLEHVPDPDGRPPGPAPCTVDDPLAWNRILVPADRPAAFHDSFENAREAWSYYCYEVFERSAMFTSLLFPHLVGTERNRLYIDLDGDGRAAPGEGLDVTGRPRFLEIEGLRTREGEPFPYAVEIVELGQETWFGIPNVTLAGETDRLLAYRRACHRRGERNGREILLVDDNSNGAYGDIGADSIVVAGERPELVGRITRVAGEFCELIIDPVGTEMRVRPWTGRTGRIHVAWRGRVEPSCLFVRGIDDDIRDALFSLVPGEDVEVPAGTYDFFYGQIRDGRGRDLRSVEMRKGECEAIVVEPDATTLLRLGAPFEARFEASEGPEAFYIEGKDIRILGTRGELYTRFYGDVPVGELVARRKGMRACDTRPVHRVETVDFLFQPDSVWHPRTVEIRKSRLGSGKRPLEARFRLESRLLGRIHTDFVLNEKDRDR